MSFRAEVIVLILSFALFSGCSLRSPELQSLPEPTKVKARLKDSIAGYKEDPAPFKVQILNESNDGEQLQIKIRLTPLTDWPASNVVLIFSALQNGIVVAQKDHCIVASCDSVPSFVKDGTKRSEPEEILNQFSPRDLTLTIATDTATDYAIDLLWGADASEYKSKLQKNIKHSEPIAPELSAIKIGNRITNCSGSTCHVSFNLNADLVNKSSLILRSITLGAGFLLSSPEAQKPFFDKTPENEDKIPLPELYLAANSSKTIEITLEQDVPRNIMARLVPNLRILAHEYEPEE